MRTDQVNGPIPNFVSLATKLPANLQGELQGRLGATHAFDDGWTSRSLLIGGERIPHDVSVASSHSRAIGSPLARRRTYSSGVPTNGLHAQRRVGHQQLETAADQMPERRSHCATGERKMARSVQSF